MNIAGKIKNRKKRAVHFPLHIAEKQNIKLFLVIYFISITNIKVHIFAWVCELISTIESQRKRLSELKGHV